MILAELEYFHSRAIAPTRRVALGDSNLPCDPAPGFGGILLGCVVAAGAKLVDDDDIAELTRLSRELEEGRRIPQPRLRFRYQIDRVGLLRSRVTLVRQGTQLAADFDEDRGLPAQQLLAAFYAAGRLPTAQRHTVFAAIRRAIRWQGPVGSALISGLAAAGGGQLLSMGAMDDPIGWALDVFGFDGNPIDERDDLAAPARVEIQRRFRDLLRTAHPDHGGDAADAAQRIADLREARRILLVS